MDLLCSAIEFHFDQQGEGTGTRQTLYWPRPVPGTLPQVTWLRAHNTGPRKAYRPHLAGEETETWVTQQANDRTEGRAQAILMPRRF